METENKIAMLIDADNVSHRNIKPNFRNTII